MQALEVTVLLVFAVIAAGLITIFIFQFDFNKFSESITNLITGEKNESGLQKVTFTEFLGRLYECWGTCISQDAGDTNALDCGAVYLTSIPGGGTSMDTNFLKDRIKAVNYCEDCNILVLPSTGVPVPSPLNMSCKTDLNAPAIIIR